MKKHIFNIIAIALVVALSVCVLVACNNYKWDAVSGGDASAAVESNGGYYVKQGDYAYIINGYDDGDSVDNTWGTPVKNGVVRVKINADGTFDNSTAAVIVPKQIYNSYEGGGIAIYGEWIYYATPNNDEDKSGTASTTHTDFMRTKIDGSVTQLITTVNTRDKEYFFTSSRILIFEDNKIEYVDFSEMDTKKSSDKKKGVNYGTLASDVESVEWNYGSDYIVYVKSESGDTSYEFCNYICMIKANGEGGEKVVADKYTYLTAEEKANYVSLFPTKVFSYAIKDSYVESDGSITIYYTKSNYINSAEESTGLYCNTIKYGETLNTSTEKHLTNTDPTSLFALGYTDGALVQMSNNNYYHVSANVVSEQDVYGDIVIGRSATVKYVKDGTVYYIDSTGGTIYAINLVAQVGNYPNETAIISAGIYTSWLDLEFVGDTLYFFDTDDYYYVHSVSLTAYAGEKIEDSTFIGIMTDADKATKAAAEE